MYSLYQLCCFFIIYSVFGWCVEVIYQASEHGKFINRGFLNGPYCPIYGFGVIIVVLCLNPIKENVLILYIGSVFLTSALELVTGFILEKIFHQKWWDYSEEHFNVKGYICLKFSLLWGIACLVAVRIIHPLVERFVNWIPHTAGVVILIILLVGFLSDTAITVFEIMHIRKRMRILASITAELRKISDFSGEKLYEATAGIKEKGEELSARSDANKEKINALLVKYKAAFEKKSMGHKRIEKAFPKLKLNRPGTLKEIIENKKKNKS
jgi:uncharacterized membrane protein